MSNGTTSREFRPQAVLLDFYGTLVEEDEAVTQQISRRLAAASPARPATEAVGSFWSRCFQRLCAESCGPAFRSQRRVEIQSLEQTLREFRADGLSADELCRDQFEYWRRPSILPEVKSVLAACPVSVCVVSNTDDDDLQSALRHVGLRFDMVVTSEDCRSYRPRPEMFEKALSLLGLPAGEVLHIGDSIRSDIAGAKAAGIPMLWINPDGRQAPAELTPDYVSRDLTGLLEFFEHGASCLSWGIDDEDLDHQPAEMSGARAMNQVEQAYDDMPEQEWGRMERHRVPYGLTMRALAEHLPPVPAKIADVGGSTGRYSIDLSRLGHAVTLVDIPDLLTCSVGATCDDFSAIAQRLEAMGTYPILWWEVPHRRHPDKSEPAVTLPGGFEAPRSLVDFVQGELERVRQALEKLAARRLDDAMLAEGIAQANRARALLRELRELCFTAPACPLGALEMLIAEMLAIHFCSDRRECIAVLEDLLGEVRRRVAQGQGVLETDGVRIFWVNPVADIQVMNLLEECGGRICGTEYLFCHALDEIPRDVPPMQALARMALADPMVGSAQDRAERICRDAQRWQCQAVVVSRIPGASHCASEGAVIADAVRSRLHLPVLEIEVPPLSDSIRQTLRTRLEALMETADLKRSISRLRPPGGRTGQ